MDHNALNPELGSEDDFRAMVDALKANGLQPGSRLRSDHMGVGGADNVWWLDVLEWGPDSARAGYFDIDWEPGARYLQGKLLTPFLGKQYGQVLEEGGLRAAVRRGRRIILGVGLMGRTSCRSARSTTTIAETRIRSWSGWGTRLQDFRAIGERGAAANDLKAELAGLAAEGQDVADAVLQAVGSFNTDLDRLHGLIQQQLARLFPGRGRRHQLSPLL